MKKIVSIVAILLFLSQSAFADIQLFNAGTNVGIITKLNVTGGTASRSGETGLIAIVPSVAAITSGTISGVTLDNSVIGGITPAAASFTTISGSGNVAINTNKFTVAASTGNTLIAGTLALTGAQTSTGAIFANGGLDRSTAAALAIGASNATSVVVTPPATYSSTVTGPGAGFGIYNLRTRVTTAQLNAGFTLLAAVSGRKYRLTNLKVISIGANMASTANATGVAVSGTQSASGAALYTVNLAQLTRSTINTLGTASTVVLADGASFVANDANTALTIAAVGGTDLITATGVDVDITYAIE